MISSFGIRSRLLAGAMLLATPAAAWANDGASPANDVTGTVTDASGTAALQGAEVTIVELGITTQADSQGRFSFGDVAPGTYTLRARYQGSPVYEARITVPETGVLNTDIVMGADSEILVIGQQANLFSALQRKRAADGVSSVITRDAIGQFPDQNVAESLRRLPGVNVLNDQGEGRFVSVRGLDPELNSSSLNGVRLPAPESDVRSVALDVISSDIIESIEVKKSLTPDMDADTIGASIEINTVSAFDRRRDLYSVKLEGSYNDYANEVSPKGSFDFATRLTDNFGVAGGISYYRRTFETDNIEADDWVEGDNGGIYAQEVQYRDYDVERERLSASLGFDARLSDTTTLYLRGIYSQFDDQEYRRRTTFDLGDFDAASSITANGVTFSDNDEEFTVERDIKDRWESQKIRSIVFGGETDTDGWHAEYSASWAKSSEREDGSLDPTQFERDFDGDGLTIAFDYSDPMRPIFTASGNTADFLDPAGYELNDIEYVALSDAQDEEYAARFDLGRSFYTGGGEVTVQGGFKGRWRTKEYNKTVAFYENDAMTLADALGTQTYRIQDIGPVGSYTGSRDYFFDNFGDFELQDIDSVFDSAVEDYRVDEDVMAGYLLARYDSTFLRVIGGVRYEHTSNYIRGNIVELYEEDATLPDGSIASDDTVVIGQREYDRDYGDWLPSLTIRWEATDGLILRAAGSRSLVRPKLSKLAPRFAVEVNDDDEREGEFGNPDLVPYKAWNLDLSAEYYFSQTGGISAGFFYKDVSNFIVDVNYDTPGSYLGLAYDEATIPLNGDSGEIYGFEFSYSQVYSFLPAPFDGLLTQINYTYTDATGTVPTDGDITDPREIMLPSSSKHTFNAVIGYEKGPVSLRLSGTYRDRYLDELGDEAETDRYVDDHFQLDLTGKVWVTDNIQLFGEWINITDAEYFAYQNFMGGQRLLQFEQYGSTVKFGTRIKF
ncbi:TonB-dependent receptor [Stakelama tenebrarum]|uniref:TonB-dependent receptor n=1 Tax=Stakelama tenebrarum TaxID=2711215 RepID=A0A6G6Y5C7_9SPHN|nr:TonB-dependent receptor [Sphingosinithalassobacter tenebrarum]QIG80007.1 TonB-dependent receptor [Sphingosinithalassobacter tenebrarum]